MIRKTPLKRTAFRPKEGKTWKKLNPISKKPHKIASRLEYEKSRQIVKARSGGQCERIHSKPYGNSFVHWRCPNPSMEGCHHLKPRSRGGSDSPCNLKDLCFDCHRWTHANPKQAEAEGLLIK